MSIQEYLKRLYKSEKRNEENMGPLYEYCARCDANLTLQKGYDNSLPYWVCKGCGQMLINPNMEDDIVWRCDECGAFLNGQDGFSEKHNKWKCAECGYENRIDPGEVYESEEEFVTHKNDPYKGLSDEQVLRLSEYVEKGSVGDKENIIIVVDRETGRRYIKKLLSVYDKSVYDYFLKHHVAHMPWVNEVMESDNCLIIIEEYIWGRTVENVISEGVLPEEQAIGIAKNLCTILMDIHNLPTPIIHRDIKPSNVIIGRDGETYLLDINVAKWFDPDKTDDTRYMGTPFYAAPEQVGYGFSASSPKSDIYALGTLLNVMITGKLPKEEKVTGRLWPIIEKCISLEAENRYTADELLCELERIKAE